VKFAFITPRYGAEISSGAEHGCRLLAEQICHRHDVDVLTTCARDDSTWRPEYSEGTDRVRGVLVRRFAVSPGGGADLEPLTARLLSAPRSRADELEWVRRLGPSSPALIEHLKRQHRTYDALVFFSLQHPTTVHGLPIAPERTVLFPHLQLDPVLRFGLWQDLLSAPRALGYFSACERRLAHSYVRADPQFEETVGIGVDAPPQQSYPRHQQDPADTLEQDDGALRRPLEDDDAEEDYLEQRGIPFRRRHRLYGRFAFYCGRVDSDNGSEEMLEYFDAYAAGDPETTLVLMGAKMMKTPDVPYLTLAGVLPDRERMVAFEAADVTIAPSADDLLGQPLLESLSVGTPVLASAANEAAVDHCRRAGGGLYYSNREEFVEAMRLLITNQRLRERLAASGRSYVQQHHRWDAVLARFDRLIARIKGR
jgi:glycosyltransferase involved in cell wall biosynthesis